MNAARIARFALLLPLFTLALPALAADPSDLCPANLPASLRPAADQRLRFARPAAGVQIYMCTQNAAGATAWTFIAPQANLFDENDELAATHFIGPVWQANDGSSVKAAKVAGASVDPTAVPWLLLKSVGNSGPGKLAGITSVQRLNTTGGNAPDASTCTVDALNKVVQVAYTADYFFYDTHVADGTNLQCR